MKDLKTTILALGCAATMSANAAITISGSDFNNGALVGSYNGTYVATPSGHMHLSFSSAGDDAVVGAKGPLGALNDLSMSFDYSNLVGGNGNRPYAAFGLSVNGLWDGSGQEYLVIATSGNQLNGATPIHVYDLTHNTDAGVVWGSTLSSILGDTPVYSGGATFGNMEVLRAYAYIGDWPNVGNVSVDINSITVSAVPEPTTMIAGVLLLLPFGASAVRFVRKNRTA